MIQGPRTTRATIADVAKEAGVSPTTVSHALNGRGKVNAETIRRVREVAERLSYRPSVRARGLRSGRSRALALLSSMPAAVSAGPSQLGFFTELAMECARTALLSGYVFVLAPPDPDSDPVGHLDIDGAILLEPEPDDSLAEELTSRGIPFVTIGAGADADQRAVRSIDLHHSVTADLILGHLIERGAQHPALIVGSSSHTPDSVIRASQQASLAAYSAAAKTSGFELIVAEALESDGEAGGFDAAARLLVQHPEIDAMFVPIDAFASGAVRAANAAGRTVGQDLLIATRYDGLRARTSSPPLTAVDLHLADVASAAVGELIAALDGEAIGGTTPTTPLPTLVIRESTGG